MIVSTFDQLRAASVSAIESTLATLGTIETSVLVIGAMLVAVIVLCLGSIWRAHRRTRVTSGPVTTPLPGISRWLTPMGLASISAPLNAVAKTRRKSGSQKAIRVQTNVSKVPARTLRAPNASALTIARRSGLARDAVTLMLANAGGGNAVAQKSKARASAPTHPSAQAAIASRAMSAPGAYTTAQRALPPKTNRALGTQFNARLS